MKITEIYSQYKIMPSLQLHMLRVSSVASIISDHMEMSVQKEDVLTACLLHDMGNILKFNLDLFPDFLQPEGKDYWQKVKDSFESKYGADEHEATIQIAKEIGVEVRIVDLIDAFRFSEADENASSNDIERMICTYSDMRVEPRKVVSLDERLTDGKKRFKLNKKHIVEDADFFNAMAQSLKKMEKAIFNATDITPEDITEEKVNLHIEKLRAFNIFVDKN